jgi:protein TonB
VYLRQQSTTGVRSGAAAIVIAAHVAVIYAVAVSLGVVEAPPIVESAKVVLVDTPKMVEPVEPVKAPEINQPDLTVPIPETVIETPVELPPIEAQAAPPSNSAPVAIPTEGTPIEATSLAVTSRSEPVYPPASRRENEEGTVRLRVLVDEMGRPHEVRVLKSSGHSRLDEAAMAAVKRWKFKPATQEAHAVKAWTQVSVQFRLDG